MNEELIQSLGAFSHALLGADEFKTLHQLFEQQMAADVLSTKPADNIERERIYAQLQGGRAFIAHLEGFAADHTRNLQAALAVPDPDDIDNPDVHDINP